MVAQMIEMFTAAMKPDNDINRLFLRFRAAGLRVRPLARNATTTSEKRKRMAKTLLISRWCVDCFALDQSLPQAVARSAEAAAPKCEWGQ